MWSVSQKRQYDGRTRYGRLLDWTAWPRSLVRCGGVVFRPYSGTMAPSGQEGTHPRQAVHSEGRTVGRPLSLLRASGLRPLRTETNETTHSKSQPDGSHVFGSMTAMSRASPEVWGPHAARGYYPRLSSAQTDFYDSVRTVPFWAIVRVPSDTKTKSCRRATSDDP